MQMGKYTAPSDEDAAPEKVVVRATDTSRGYCKRDSLPDNI